MISGLYDPLGLIAPFLLEGRMILQNVCAQRFDWDDVIDDVICKQWMKWKQSLQNIEKIRIPRSFKEPNFGNIVDASLHYFSDASEKGYGQSTYLRLVDDQGKITCRLVVGKARVAPLKFTSVPRLELTAAALSVKISVMLRKELDMPINSVKFWTDSQIVLGYLRNETKRFKTFVANRIQIIKDNSNVDDWFFIPSKENPADIASRGIIASSAESRENLWYYGPKFFI